MTTSTTTWAAPTKATEIASTMAAANATASPRTNHCHASVRI